MPSLETYAVFVATCLVLLAIPGPAVLYVVSRSVDQGRAAGLASVAGIYLCSPEYWRAWFRPC